MTPSALALAESEVRVVDRPTSVPEGPHYTANRPPLAPSLLVKLPIGSITPQGWLRGQLELEAGGMTGRLAEVSPWCRFEGNSWADPKGQGHSGWEELPYWLKGYGDLGYVLNDEKVIATTRKWIEAVFAGQEADGWFGPRGLKTSLEGKPDLWPQMVMLNVLQSYYEHGGDRRVLELMTRYFRWQLNFPEKDFLVGYWPRIRGGDNLESIYWLYNRTGEAWLLELATKVHRRTADWTSGVPDWHGVNITQAFREPGIYYLQAKDASLLKAVERNYQTVLGIYGQFPGGGFASDEVCRPGYIDPRQGFETCSMVEFMHSFQLMTRVSADPLWADRCEDVAFNSLPAALTPDWKALHYLTGANMTQLDKENKAPGIMNSGTMFSYSPLAVYRCCQHNVSHGWPYYAEELWLGTADRGLCASLYAASSVQAKVGPNEGTTVTIKEETDYPFRDTVNFTIEPERAVKFPLYLRIPRWCGKAQVAINGQAAAVEARPSSYLVIERTWQPGDKVQLSLPMEISLRTWEKNQRSVSVDRGPLTYSLLIGERWRRYGGKDDWPEQEVFATTPWNYALVLDRQQPARSFEVQEREGPIAAQPFTIDAAPVKLAAKGRRIPAWKQDHLGLVGKLQASPVKTDEPVEQLTLIPMGCARLRISSFPVYGDGPDAHAWKPPPRLPLASHCFEGDTVEALNDGREPARSSDPSIRRFTWWNHRGSKEWVQYDFEQPRAISKAKVYWYDDTGKGHCRPPKSWRLVVRRRDDWQPVSGASGYSTALDRYNEVSFEKVETTAVRLEAELQPEFSAGILEWKVE
jgi:hypothetical protein